MFSYGMMYYFMPAFLSTWFTIIVGGLLTVIAWITRGSDPRGVTDRNPSVALWMLTASVCSSACGWVAMLLVPISMRDRLILRVELAYWVWFPFLAITLALLIISFFFTHREEFSGKRLVKFGSLALGLVDLVLLILISYYLPGMPGNRF